METKPKLSSATVHGIIVALLGLLAQASSSTWAPENIQAAADILTKGLELAGLAIAFWGRMRANKPLTPFRLPGGAGPAAGALLLCLVIGGGIAGCTQAMKTYTEPMLDAANKPLKDDKGNVLTRTVTVPVEADYYHAQGLPIWEFRAPQDKDVTFPAGSYMAVRSGRVSQYVPESTQNLREGKSLAGWGFGAFAVDRLERVATNGIAAAGSRSTEINNAGAGSSASVAGGNAGQATGASTTTSTDSHDMDGAAQ